MKQQMWERRENGGSVILMLHFLDIIKGKKKRGVSVGLGKREWRGNARGPPHHLLVVLTIPCPFFVGFA
jgi:hypothetical protein